MKISRKFLSLLALLILMSSVVSCGDTTSSDTDDMTDTNPVSDNAPETTAAEVTTDYLATLPDRDLGGRDFIISVDERNYNSIPNTRTDKETGEIINDTLFRRDSNVEEAYNINIGYDVLNSNAAQAQKVKNVILSGDETYHLILGSMTAGTADLASAGLLYDLSEMPYFALDENWWVPQCNSQLYIGDSLYFAASPLLTTYFATPFAVTFNKRLTADYNVPDLYKTVKDGDWTIEYMRGLASGISSDLNNDGAMDENDFYGMATHRTALWSYYASSGIVPLRFNSDYTYEIELGSAKSQNVIENLAKIMSDRSEVYYWSGENVSHALLFNSGKAMFADHSIAGFIINYRDMEDDWGIIPIPKYDESQDNYITSLQAMMPCSVAVPLNCSAPEETGMITEMLAFISDIELRNAVYDILLTGRVARDEDSVTMLDMIYADANVDMIYVYQFASANQKVFDAIIDAVPFASTYESIREPLEGSVEKFVETLKK